MDSFLNVALLKQPLNYLIVFFMVWLILIPLALIHARYLAETT